ncbi:MAG: SH3 domain-containing protein [Clostridia bacterium]|nr:SH3 domain-containing protein [Clostridia bacterium]
MMKQTGFFKRFIAVLLLMAMVLPAVPVSAAAGQYGYVVIPESSEDRVVNFRKNPNTKDNVNYPIARLPEYWVVEIMGLKDVNGTEWYQVQANIGVNEGDPVKYETGFIMAQFIRVMSDQEADDYLSRGGNYFRYSALGPQATDAIPLMRPAVPASTLLKGYLITTVNNATLYNAAGRSARIISETIPKGTMLPYYEVVPITTVDAYEWVLVVYNGGAGYLKEGTYQRVSQSSVSTAQTVTNTSVQVNPTVQANTAVQPAAQATAYVEPQLVPGQTVGMVTRDNVFFRKDMSTAGDFWARLPYGWTMTVLAKEVKGKTTWYKVKGGTPENRDRVYTGYIHGDYFILLNATATATPAPWYVPTGLPTAAPTAAPQGDSDYGLVLVDGLNMRQTPGGTTVSVLRVNTVVSILTKPTSTTANDWYFVKYDNVMGYLPATSLRVLNTYELPNYVLPDGKVVTASPTPEGGVPVTAAPTPYTPAGSQGYIKLLKGGVNLRATAGGTTIAQLAKDTVLPYFNVVTTGNKSLETWYEVYSSQKGVFGYILSTMAEQCDAQGNPITPVLPTGTPTGLGYVATSVSGVWLRATPYTDGDIVGQVKTKGTVLPLIGAVVKNGYDWYPVRTTDGKQGYLRGDCVFTLAEWQLEEYQKSGKVPTPTPGPATPRPGNSSYIMTTTDKVYIRQSPTTQSTAVGQVALGTVLKFNATQTTGLGTKNQVTWYQVTYAGQLGWMHGSFVRVLTNAEYDAMYATPTPKPGTTAVPTAAPVLENLSDLAYTILDKVNIRASASMSGRDIEMIDKANTEVTYLGKYTVPDPQKNNNYYWFYIRYGKVTGWVRGDCIHVLTETEKAQRKNPAVITAPPTGYNTLALNSSGDEVYALQYKLYQLGYLAGDQVNGYYRATTEAAVAAFQRAKGLTVDGVAGAQTQQALYGTASTVTAAPNNGGGTNGQYVNGSSTTVTLYPVEKSDWFTGDIQDVWPNGSVAILTDVYTGISFKAQRLYGGNHADAEPVDTADTAAICAIYGVSKPQEIEDREQELQSYRRRPTWVTVGGRTFCASVYGIPHNYSGDRIANNGYNGQFCVHFTNSRTHTSNIVDPDASYNNYFGAQSAIQYAYEHSISGWK